MLRQGLALTLGRLGDSRGVGSMNRFFLKQMAAADKRLERARVTENFPAMRTEVSSMSRLLAKYYGQPASNPERSPVQVP